MACKNLSASSVVRMILDARKKIHVDGHGMVPLYSDGPFEVFLTTGDWGQDRMVVTTRNVHLDWEKVRWTKIRSLGDRYAALLSTAPSGKWVLDVIRLIDPNGIPGRYPPDVISWANCAKILTFLPRIIWSREDHAGIDVINETNLVLQNNGIVWGNPIDMEFMDAASSSGNSTAKARFPGTGGVINPRRQKRTLLVRCGFHDTFVREMLGAMGGVWDRDRRAWKIEKRPHELDEIEYILAVWSNRRKSSLVGQAFFEEEDIRDKYPFLKDHQVDGVRFLRERWNDGMHGTLLADDTGMGKSATFLASALPALEDFTCPRIVVVGVSSALFQWEEEWKNLFGQSPEDVFYYTGDFEAKNRSRKRPMDNTEIQELLMSKKLILTNYEFVSYMDKKTREMKYLKTLIPAAMGSVLCLDECTKFKNDKTGNFRAALMLSMVSSFTIGLTADPIVNNIGEMWRIMRVLDPSIYPKKEFYKNHVEMKDLWFFNRKAPAVNEKGNPVYDPITGQRKMGRKMNIKVEKYHDIDLFNAIMRPHFLRRLKTVSPHIIANEPKWIVLRTEGSVEEQVSQIIINKYEQWYRRNLRLEDLIERSQKKNRTSSFDISTYLQQASDDPYTLFMNLRDQGELLPDEERDETDEEKIDRECRNEIRDAFLAELDPEELREYVPLKAQRMISMMRENPKEKVVIFSTYKKTVERLSEHIGEVFPGRRIFTATGDMSKAKKRQVVKESQQTPGSLLICTDTLSLAMNLQQADSLFQYTIMWEPLTLEQRCGRIERMGGKTQKNIYILSSDLVVEEAKRRSIEGKKWVKRRALQR